MKRYLLSSLLIFGFGGSVSTKTPSLEKQPPSFKISDEELKALNLNEKETAELKEFFSALDNLSPAQKQELEDLGRATEEKMRKKGLDPTNMDDMMKFMESEGLTQPQAKRPQPQKRPERKKPAPAAKPKQQEDIPLPLVTSADAATMLRELTKHLASLRQKIITRPALYNQFDRIIDQVSQLGLYLNILQAPDMVKLVTDKEFVRLYTSLEVLHKAFKRYEPSITARKKSPVTNDDNPYLILDIPYNATQNEIEQRFQEIKAVDSPEVVKARLAQEGMDEKMASRFVRASERTFSLEEKAYKKLIDPERRKKIDESLCDVIAQEERQEQQSNRAFEALFSALQTAFSADQMLMQMNQLLMKYKPQEAAQLKEQLEREKQVYERSKRKVIVPQMRPTTTPGSSYDSFYRQMSQRQSRRPGRRPQYRPSRPRPGRGMPTKPAAQPAAKGTEKGAPKKAGKKSDGPPKKDTKKAAPKGTSKTASKSDSTKKAAPELTDKDFDALINIRQAGSILKKHKEGAGKLEITQPLRSGQPAQKVTLTFRQIMNRLEAELSGSGDATAAADLKTYFDTYKLDQLQGTLKKLASDVRGKKLSHDQVKKEWNNVKASAEDLTKLSDAINQQLSFALRPSYGYRGAVPAAKKQQYGLTQTSLDPWVAEDDQPALAQTAGVNLNKIRSTARALKEYIKVISTAAQ